jgi:hypothetical protein
MIAERPDELRVQSSEVSSHRRLNRAGRFSMKAV